MLFISIQNLLKNSVIIQNILKDILKQLLLVYKHVIKYFSNFANISEI